MSSEQEPILDAIATSVKFIQDILRCIAVRSNTCVIHISEAGLRLSVGESQSLEANAFLGHEIFSSFRYIHPDPTTEDELERFTSFQISLKSLIGCLSVFGSDVRDKSSLSQHEPGNQQITRIGGSCRFSFFANEPLSITIEESGVITTCSLTSYEPDFFAQVPFNDEQLAFKIIMKSDWLYDALQEMDTIGGSDFIIDISPNEPNLRLSSVGAGTAVELEYPDSKDVLETFSCVTDARFVYHWSLIQTTMRATSASSKVSIRADAESILNIQFMLISSSNQKSFVEFKMLAKSGPESDSS